MKTRILFCLLAFSMMNQFIQASCQQQGSARNSAKYDGTGRTFLFVRPLFQSNMPEMLTGFRDELFHAKCEGWGAFQGVLFGSSSYDDEQLQRYFTPFGKTKLIVSEPTASSLATSNLGGAYTPTRDLFTQHFNIFTENGTFQSEIEFQPHQSMVGFGMHYRKDFWRNEDKNRALYWSLSTPLTSVRNTMKIKENVTNDGGGVNNQDSPIAVPNMTAAFSQAAWQYGKIGSTGSGTSCSNTMHKTKLADIEVKLGIEWIERHPCHFESYVGLLIPTGNKPTGEYIFEPIVGWGGHVGILFGSHAGATIWENECEDKNLRLEYSLHSQYLFSTTQVRSLDLKNKPFSRYAQIYTSAQDALNANILYQTNARFGQNSASQGINTFTRQLKVSPGYMYNLNSALVWSADAGFQGEAGYNLFFRHEDSVKLACPFPTGVALKHYAGGGQTYPVRTMSGFLLVEDPEGFFGNQEALINYNYNTITQDDLDLKSAAQPAIMTHTLYGYLGYRWLEKNYPLSAGFGGSAEFGKANCGAVNRWVLWAKVGVAF